MGGEIHVGDGQPPPPPSLRGARSLLGAFGGGEQRASIVQKRRPGFGQRYAMRITLEQRGAEPGFEVADGAADGGLSQMGALGGSTETQGFRHRDEGAIDHHVVAEEGEIQRLAVTPIEFAWINISRLRAPAEIMFHPVVIDGLPVFLRHHRLHGFQRGNGDAADLRLEGRIH